LIADRAEQSVITGCRVVGVNTTKYRIAGIIRTQVSVITDRRGSPNTGTTGTGIISSTGVPVITCYRVVGVDTARCRVTGVIGAQITVITVRRGSPNTGTTGTGISRGTGISVVAGVSVVGINTADSRIAGVIGTQVAIITVWRGSPNTGTGGTGVIGGTGITIVTGCRVVRVQTCTGTITLVIGTRVSVIGTSGTRGI